MDKVLHFCAKLKATRCLCSGKFKRLNFVRSQPKLQGYDYLVFYKGLLVNKFYNFIEPVSSASPKLTSGDKLISVEASQRKSITLLCPAQGFPVPSYRSEIS